MAELGIRELKARASEIVRRVRERRARYVITYRGRPVAMIGPLESSPVTESEAGDPGAWDELERLGDAVGKGWRSPKTSVEILSESRR
ncbi:MAG TPA: type II toxin-antitoxin system prevent-host-death family antitoxin [bacterium]|nr:type II toxin-antitoxin system prevent-host-death family antitoxin [bacterium]